MYIRGSLRIERANAALNSVTEDSRCTCIDVRTRYRCDVIGQTAVDVVSGMGGWLVDLAMAGWEVTVALAERQDARPLRILGSAVVDLDKFMMSFGRGPFPRLLALTDQIWGRDDLVCREVRSARALAGTQVAVCGRGAPVLVDGESGCALSPARQHLSVAGCAFKAPALFELTEPCWTTGPLAYIHACIWHTTTYKVMPATATKRDEER